MTVVDEAKVCGAYYGTGATPYSAAICRRPEGHPSINEDGIGHRPYPMPTDSISGEGLVKFDLLMPRTEEREGS